MFFLVLSAQAQVKEDFPSYAEMECIEGNCKNGEGTLKVYPKGKDDKRYLTYKGTFEKKKLVKGTLYGNYWGWYSITGNFIDGRIALNDTMVIETSEWKGIGVFFEQPNFQSSDEKKLWADIWYNGNPEGLKPLRAVGSMRFSASAYVFSADWQTIMYANGVQVVGGGLQGRMTLPCGPSGFNDGGSHPVLRDTLPGNIVREGMYDLGKLCIRNGWFAHYMPDGTEYSVRYENDSAVFQYHISKDSIQRRRAMRQKAIDEAEERKELARWRASPGYRALMAKYESSTSEAVNAALKKAREEGKKQLAKYYEEEGSSDPDACAHCKGKGKNYSRRCGARGCINGKVKDNAGQKVTIIDGGIGKKGVGFTPQYREFECNQCKGEGYWVCYVCQGSGKKVR